MIAFLVRRAIGLVVTLFVASFAVFGALYLAPGDPLSFMLGGRSVTPEVVASLRDQYALDEPFPTRYWDWLTGLLHGDLGESLVFHQDVGTLLGPRAATTLWLTVYASLVIVVVGLALGIVAALRGGRTDTSILVATTVGVAVPSFVAAILLIAVFGVWLGWFPVFGSGQGFTDRLHHLTLPALALAASASALITRITRTSLRVELDSEHVQTAISRGIPRRKVFTRHVLRNGLMPIATAAGLVVVSLAAGAVVVDRAFALNGLGSLLVTSVQSHDFAVVQAIALLLVVVVVLVNTLVDVLYVVIDPRIRKGGRA
ncbi:ABC transporter permease [Streptomyces sp. SID3343]|uniref:ABC transporter permease n=1 Tax=Streptomyces sp. SID3343 TaxID=2690260 RepID=UPI001371A461|nr:ABC transporter permease [Streptomyces sp. SID3343]MYW03295.1 ABC transporter permease subunit [Streptomyces sp. SID3343]